MILSKELRAAAPELVSEEQAQAMVRARWAAMGERERSYWTELAVTEGRAEAGLCYLLSKLAAELVAGGYSQEAAELEVREKWRGMGQEEKAMWCRVARSET